MIRRVRSWYPTPGVLAALVLLATPCLFASSEDETLYCSDPTTNQILQIDFTGADTTVVNTDAASLRRLGGIAVRDDVSDIQVIVADTGASRVLFYQDAQGSGQTIATGLSSASGLTLDGAGNVYVVGRKAGLVGLGRGVGLVWVIPRRGSLPGGYSTPVLIDGLVPSSRLAEARTYPADAGGVLARDLFVVSELPPAVFRYPRGSGGFGPRQTFLPRSAFPFGAQPVGIAFAPSGQFLIASRDGRVLRYDKTGSRLLPDFASGLPTGPLKITVGIQDGVDRVFVSGGGVVSRFTIQANGTGAPDGSLSACSAGGGISLGTGTAAPTAIGTGVHVVPATEVEIDFDDVAASGLTAVRLVEFPDNRAPGTDQGLRAFFPGLPIVQALLPDVLVPKEIQAFPKARPGDPSGGPYTGPPTFLMAIVDTTADFRRTARFHGQEKDRLGYQPKCSDSDQTMQPRTFYAPETDPPKSEAPLVEGAVFTDFSTGCGSNIGRGSRFSLWLTARDLRPAATIVNDKYDNLQNAMVAYSAFIEDSLEATLNADIAASRAAFTANDHSGAISQLVGVVVAIDSTPLGFLAHPANVPGQLIARSLSLKFMISKVP